MKDIRWEGANPPTSLLLAYLRGHDHPAKIRVVRMLMSIFFSKGVRVQNTLGTTLCLRPQDYIDWAILSLGSYEGATLARAVDILSPKGGLFLDVGANFGLFTCTLGMIPGVECYAVEPWAKNFLLLKNNLSLNPDIKARLFNVALSNSHQLLDLEDSNPGNPGAIRVAFGENGSKNPGHTVAAVTLEDMLAYARAERITLMKIDVEGYEPLVLEGLNWQGRYRPAHVLIEFSDYVARSKKIETRQGLLDFFTQRGYAGRTVDGQPLSLDQAAPESNVWMVDTSISPTG